MPPGPADAPLGNSEFQVLHVTGPPRAGSSRAIRRLCASHANAAQLTSKGWKSASKPDDPAASPQELSGEQQESRGNDKDGRPGQHDHEDTHQQRGAAGEQDKDTPPRPRKPAPRVQPGAALGAAPARTGPWLTASHDRRNAPQGGRWSSDHRPSKTRMPAPCSIPKPSSHGKPPRESDPASPDLSKLEPISDVNCWVAGS